jgi:HAMP domain-containing protein
MQIRTRLAIAVLASMAVVAAIAGSIIRSASERNIGVNAEAAVVVAAGAFRAVEHADTEKLSAVLTAVLSDSRYRDPFERRDRAALTALATPLFKELKYAFGITHWYFHLPDRTVFLRVHKPEQFGDAVNRATMARAVATGGPGAGKELGKTAFALRVVRPWVVDGKLLGYVELGEEIDGFLHRMKEQTGDDYSLLVEKRHLDGQNYASVRQNAGLPNDWNALPALVALDTTLPDVKSIGWSGEVAALPEAGTFLDEAREGSSLFGRGVLPVTDAAQVRVGALVVRRDITGMHDTMTRAQLRVIALVVALSILSAAFLVIAVNVLVFDRLNRMTALLEDVAARLVGGDYNVATAIPAPKAQDEIGRFESFFGRFVAVVGETLQGLTNRRG